MINDDPIDSDGGPVNDGCRQRTARPWLTFALTIAAGSLSSCGDLGDGVETVESALTTTTATLNFGTAQRVLKRDCGQRCTKYTLVGGSLHGFQCQQWVPDCLQYGPSATLHADAAAAASNTIFPGYNEGASWQYSGCGPQAAQNVLNYYGVQMPIAEVEQYISTFALIAGSHDHGIATFPDDLASGLQRLLNERVAPGHFIVRRRSGVTVSNELDTALRNGNPLIMLVNGGDHYQVATGVDLTRAYVLDYPGNDTWRAQYDLGMDLPWYSDIFSTVSFGAGGYEDYTVITIDYVANPCGLMTAGQSLTPGQSVSSCDNRFHLIMQGDGNLVLYQGVVGQPMNALWATNTWGTTGQAAWMQSDGNFVLYDADGNALWATNTWGKSGAYLSLQNDGNLVINYPGSTLWTSGTGGH